MTNKNEVTDKQRNELEKETNMTNAFTTAFEARISTAKAKNSTQQNIDKLTKMRDAFSSQALVKLFEDSNIDASRLQDRAIYASEKVVRFAAQAVEHSVALNNQMMYVVFRTAINCYRHNVTMTRDDAKAACLNTLVSEERKHLVFSRKITVADSTKNAQYQSSVDALLTLNILKQKNANEFEVVLNDLAKALCEKLAIDCEKVETAEAA